MSRCAAWPGQVEYRLNRAASELRPHEQRDYAEAGMEQGLAIFELVSERSE